MVIANCLWYLPTHRAASMTNIDWCKVVAREVAHEKKEGRSHLSQLLITALQNGMVQMHPADRSSADFLLTSTLHKVRVELHVIMNQIDDDAEGSTDSEYERTLARQAGSTQTPEAPPPANKEASPKPKHEPMPREYKETSTKSQGQATDQESGLSQPQRASHGSRTAPGQHVSRQRGAESSQMGVHRYNMRTRKRSAEEASTVEGTRVEDKDDEKIRGHHRRKSSKTG